MMGIFNLGPHGFFIMISYLAVAVILGWVLVRSYVGLRTSNNQVKALKSLRNRNNIDDDGGNA